MERPIHKPAFAHIWLLLLSFPYIYHMNQQFSHGLTHCSYLYILYTRSFFVYSSTHTKRLDPVFHNVDYLSSSAHQRWYILPQWSFVMSPSFLYCKRRIGWGISDNYESGQRMNEAKINLVPPRSHKAWPNAFCNTSFHSFPQTGNDHQWRFAEGLNQLQNAGTW